MVKKQNDVLLCPKCGTKMKKLKRNDVVLDVCPNCKGMWLDAGEIDKLAVHKRNKS